MSSDPEAELRAIWDAQGVSKERQEELLSQITEAAQPGAQVGPWRIPEPSTAELFDTADYSPLFAGIPVPVNESAARKRQNFEQPAFFCFLCHQGGQLILARDGHRYCTSCARKFMLGQRWE